MAIAARPRAMGCVLGVVTLFALWMLSDSLFGPSPSTSTTTWEVVLNEGYDDDDDDDGNKGASLRGSVDESFVWDKALIAELSVPMLFRVHGDGKRVEGTLVFAARELSQLPVRGTSSAKRKESAGTDRPTLSPTAATPHDILTALFHGEKGVSDRTSYSLPSASCTWCPLDAPTPCLEKGRLSFQMDDEGTAGGRPMDAMQTEIAAQRSYVTGPGILSPYNNRYRSVSTRCDFDDAIPWASPGRVIIRRATKDVGKDQGNEISAAFVVAPRMRPRRLSRDLLVRVIVAPAVGVPPPLSSLRHILTSEPDRPTLLVFYELGMTTPEIRKYLEQSPLLPHADGETSCSRGAVGRRTRAVVVDLREALQEAYGMLYQDVLLFTDVGDFVRREAASRLSDLREGEGARPEVKFTALAGGTRDNNEKAVVGKLTWFN